jgi:hypothetical protein
MPQDYVFCSRVFTRSSGCVPLAMRWPRRLKQSAMSTTLAGAPTQEQRWLARANFALPTKAGRRPAVADDIVLNKLKDHADLARHVEDAGWKLRIGNRGPEVAPNLFQDAVDKIETQQAEIQRLLALLGHAAKNLTAREVENDEQNDDIIRLLSEVGQLRAVRNAERALADQLARALLDGPFRGDRHDRRDRMYGSGWADVNDALDTWQEARRG